MQMCALPPSVRLSIGTATSVPKSVDHGSSLWRSTMRAASIAVENSSTKLQETLLLQMLSLENAAPYPRRLYPQMKKTTPP